MFWKPVGRLKGLAFQAWRDRKLGDGGRKIDAICNKGYKRGGGEKRKNQICRTEKKKPGWGPENCSHEERVGTKPFIGLLLDF